MADENDICVQQNQPNTEAESYIWKYFADILDHRKKGGCCRGSKNLQCKFCDRSFSGMSTTHILGRPVMGQTTSGIKSCIAIKKAEDDRHADLKKARDELAAVIREGESVLDSIKRKQGVLDTIMSPKSKQSSAPNTKKSNKQHLDRAVARFCFENAMPFNVATSSSFADMIGESLSFRENNSLQSYKVPGRLKLSGQLLDDAYRSV